MTAPSILAAKADAEAARADLTATVSELQARLAPRKLAQDAWTEARGRAEDAWTEARGRAEDVWGEVRERGEDLADRGAHFAKRRPAATAGIAVSVVAIVARKPLGRFVKWLFTRQPPIPRPDLPLNASDLHTSAKTIHKETVS